MTWKSLNHYLTYPSIFRNRNFWVLFGTCSTWFLLDISFYSQNLFLPNVLVNPPTRSRAELWSRHPVCKCRNNRLHRSGSIYPIRGRSYFRCGWVHARGSPSD